MLNQFLGALSLIIVIFYILMQLFTFIKDVIEWMNRMSNLKQQLAEKQSQTPDSLRGEIEDFVRKRSKSTKKSKRQQEPDVLILSEASKTLPESANTLQNADVIANPFEMLLNPQTVQQAIIVNAILNRPKWSL